MKKKLLLPKVLFALATLITFCLPAFAYQEINVQNGGTIKGNAKMTGAMPFPRVYHLILFPNIDMCAEVDTDDEMNRVLDDFKVSPDRGLKDVVITLEHVEAGKPFNKEPINILSENCKFFPDVNLIRQGETFKVDNVDAVMHNSQVYQKERGKILLNIPIPAEEVSEGKVTFKKKYKIMQMICGMHEFMQTWGYRIQNPYYFKTDEHGNYNIGDIPPGEYINKALRDIDIRKKYGLNIIAIKKKMKIVTKEGEIKEEQKINVAPEPGNTIRDGDILIVVGTNEHIEAFKKRD